MGLQNEIKRYKNVVFAMVPFIVNNIMSFSARRFHKLAAFCLCHFNSVRFTYLVDFCNSVTPYRTSDRGMISSILHSDTEHQSSKTNGSTHCATVVYFFCTS